MLRRGVVYRLSLPGIAAGEPKYYVVVSNNIRNRQLGSALVLRITTTPKPNLPSVVELGSADPLIGRVICDDIYEALDSDRPVESGAMSPATMRGIEAGLKHVYGLS